jgi:hypothetical protein
VVVSRLRPLWRADLLLLVALLAAVGLIASASVGTGEPSAAVAVGDGFGAETPERGTVGRWLEQPSGTLRLSVVGPSRPLRLRMELASFDVPRRVAVTLDGRPVARLNVYGEYAEQVVPLGRVRPGLRVIGLRPAPGLQSIDETLHNGDPRSVSIRLLGAPTVEGAE